LYAIAVLVLSTPASADEPVSFRGKTIAVIVGSPAGGGTDASARLIASLMANYLPGKPAVLVRNIPGAQGITAMNYFVKQVAPDGLTVVMASTTQADPLLYRKAQAQFDPTTFAFVGGVGRGGTVLLLRKESEPRLHSTSAAPVMMGALGGVPRSGMQTTAWGVEFLGWNAKWVLGYRGTSDLMIALERGEIDMTSTANLFQVQKFLDNGRFRTLVQSGALHGGKIVPRPEFGDAPLFTELIQSRIKDPIAQKAFDYWSSLTSLDKWFALPPHTPEPFVRAYRAAYKAAAADPEFAELGKRISEDIDPMAYEDVELLIHRLGGTPPEAIAYLSAMLRKQGIEAE
jgi:tripartite-type tricarboxylate transporter receptor subunit TctC